MFAPKFPYTGNQIILSSGRVMIHSKDDAIFLFGKQAVGISSTKTINLDANEKILLSCPKIELGARAETAGEPVILGKTFTRELKRVMDQLYIASVFLSQASESDVATSMLYISTAGDILAGQVETFQNVLAREETLSKNTFTR
jgi:hypothetical protein